MDQLNAALVRFLAANPDSPGVMMHVDAPRAGVSWSGAAGVSEIGGEALLATQPIRTASITKTFVATAILTCIESGAFVLDDVALPLLPELAAIPFAAAMGEAANEITLRHLLQHTSGLFDFGNAAQYRRLIASEPTKVWTALDLISIAFDHGAPVGRPGGQFHYSDTGYVLLALILERATGMPIASALRDRVGFESLGLHSTWFEGKESMPDGVPPRAHQYMTGADTYHFDPSFDGYGGGGLASTSRDLAAFVGALLGGRIIGSASLAEMLSFSAVTDLGEVGQRCGLGIFESVVNGVRRIGHEGFWGVWMYHYPDHDITVAGAHTGLPYDITSKRELLHIPVSLFGIA
ncbi:MAG: serine hydrolase domain-containing protein [Actinomycetota bacterium]